MWQVQEMENDPLNSNGNVRARTANEFLKAFRHVFEREHELQLPIYAHHGGSDRLANLSVCPWVTVMHTTSCRLQAADVNWKSSTFLRVFAMHACSATYVNACMFKGSLLPESTERWQA